MKRRALIIVNPGQLRKKDYLPGTLIDKDNYYNFLKSNLGGNWYDDEIYIIENSGEKTVDNHIKLIGDANYSFIVFSGHGGMYKNDNRMVIELSTGEYDVSKLKTSCLRQTLILDTCRVYIESVGKSIYDMKKFAELLEHKYRSTRSLFEEELSKCGFGQTILYSCSKNQTSGENKIEGGYFSNSLLMSCYEWDKKSRNDNCLTLYEAYLMASIDLRNNVLTNQIPEISINEHSKKNYPLAVKY